MKRKDFIQTTTAATAFIGLGGLSALSFKPNYAKHITILHTNDVHSHIEAFGPNDARFPNMGGVARRATL
ncbi:MAG: bifunctional metallophosphatase/5'-nucleotidase, partial [Salegentibacter sp.]